MLHCKIISQYKKQSFALRKIMAMLLISLDFIFVLYKT